MATEKLTIPTDYLSGRPRPGCVQPPHRASFLDHCLGATSRPVDIEGWELILRARRSEDEYMPEVVPAPFYEADGQKLEVLIGRPLDSLYDTTARHAYPADCLRELELQLRSALHRLRGTRRLIHRLA
jgi:hypothetical protein